MHTLICIMYVCVIYLVIWKWGVKPLWGEGDVGPQKRHNLRHKPMNTNTEQIPRRGTIQAHKGLWGGFTPQGLHPPLTSLRAVAETSERGHTACGE